MVRDPRGRYVFRVGASVPAREATLESARSQVTQDLETRRSREIVEAFNAKLRSRYRQETVCSDGYELPDCS